MPTTCTNVTFSSIDNIEHTINVKERSYCYISVANTINANLPDSVLKGGSVYDYIIPTGHYNENRAGYN